MTDTAASPTPDRLTVRKTHKLFVGGGFPRSESGRTYPVSSHDGRLLAHAALASRKDARDAVVAARGALGRWSGATAYNRGQVVYRVAELLEGRSAQLAELVADAEGCEPDRARRLVAQSVDRWVWYAGWTDKLAQVAGGANPVAGPYANWSAPEPSGVVAVLAPQQSSLLGLTSVVAPALATGCTCVVVTSRERPLPAVALAEAAATADVPAGVLNLLTGSAVELGPWLAAHRDVDVLDLTGATELAWAELERAAAESLTRVIRPAAADDGSDAAVEPDWTAPPDPGRLLALVETKTVWHPKGR